MYIRVSYGIGKKDKFCDENSPLRPVSLYGRTKCDAENEVKKHKNSICFRLATVFGCSYRMRSDLLVNNFVYSALKNKKLTIYEPNFRRNFIHVKDVVDGIVYSVKNFNKLKSNIYNLGLSSANLSKLMLAKKIKNRLKYLKIAAIMNYFLLPSGLTIGIISLLLTIAIACSGSYVSK